VEYPLAIFLAVCAFFLLWSVWPSVKVSWSWCSNQIRRRRLGYGAKPTVKPPDSWQPTKRSEQLGVRVMEVVVVVVIVMIVVIITHFSWR
jgi:hypothetical protein